MCHKLICKSGYLTVEIYFHTTNKIIWQRGLVKEELKIKVVISTNEDIIKNKIVNEGIDF